jgi:hypothetical protein
VHVATNATRLFRGGSESSFALTNHLLSAGLVVQPRSLAVQSSFAIVRTVCGE